MTDKIEISPEEVLRDKIKADPYGVRERLDALDLMHLPEGATVRASFAIDGIAEKADAKVVADQLAEICGLEVSEPGSGYSWWEVGFSGNIVVHYDKATITAGTRCAGCPLAVEEV